MKAARRPARSAPCNCQAFEEGGVGHQRTALHRAGEHAQDALVLLLVEPGHAGGDARGMFFSVRNSRHWSSACSTWKVITCGFAAAPHLEDAFAVGQQSHLRPRRHRSGAFGRHAAPAEPAAAGCRSSDTGRSCSWRGGSGGRNGAAEVATVMGGRGGGGVTSAAAGRFRRSDGPLPPRVRRYGPGSHVLADFVIVVRAPILRGRRTGRWPEGQPGGAGTEHSAR